jgi:hypothetical protein
VDAVLKNDRAVVAAIQTAVKPPEEPDTDDEDDEDDDDDLE